MDDELISEARKIAIDFNGVEQKLKPVHLQHRMRIGINRMELYHHNAYISIRKGQSNENLLVCVIKQ